ncbi:hypothetical protein IAD21_00787 [Abditibacteriota bacterium]|nr:hypothetical protein IAD21_00787 [Abditibacteriota bacterium]
MSLRSYYFVVLLVLMASVNLSCLNQPALAQSLSRLSFDFNDGPSWTQAQAYASVPQRIATASWQPVGSYNVAGSAVQSGAWRLTADSSLTKTPWMAGLNSGNLAIHNTETNLGKLTLSFTLSASAARPVKVKITSFDARGRRTGGLESLIYPAAPDFLQRYSLDLNTFQSSGKGKFNPKAPQIQFAFEMDSTVWPQGRNEIRVDDVNYSGPAFYVSPTGRDSNDGKSEKTAFATPQKALDVALPGDTILLMDGTYNGGGKTVASFPRAGTPAAWIVLKNYPGQHPLLTCTGWNTINIAKGSKTEPYEGPTLAYLEVRGLHIRGEGDVAKQKYPDAMNKPDPRTNTNGIAIDGRYMKNTPHHLRMADNLVEYCPGAGIGPLEADWVTMENNISRCNCWTTIYATSGMGTLGSSNFDAAENIYKMLLRNNICYRNQTYEIWEKVKHASDGNGIIIDVNQHSDARPEETYKGRTLVTNNLCFDNGGSGIHTVSANRVDIINNTTYLNSANKDLQYSQIFTYGSDDVRIMNNILVAPVADVAAGEKPEPVNRISGKNSNVIFSHNLYFGGNIAPTLGEGDRIGDPQFVLASRDPKLANFHLKSRSPAIGMGISQPFGPFLDLNGNPRGATLDLGAYRH